MDEGREPPNSKRRRLLGDHYDISSSTRNVQTPYHQQHSNLQFEFPNTSQTVSNDLRLPYLGYLSNSPAAHGQDGRVTGMQPYIGENPVQLLHPGQPQNFAQVFVNHGAEYGRRSNAWTSPTPFLPDASHTYSSSQNEPWQQASQTAYHFHAQPMTLPQLHFPVLNDSFVPLHFSQIPPVGHVQGEVSSSHVGEYNSWQDIRSMHVQMAEIPLDEFRTTVPGPAKQIVCFGMIPRIAATCKLSKQSSNPAEFAASITSSDVFVSSCSDPSIQGRIPTEHGQMMQSLLDETGLELYAFCSIDGGTTSTKSDRVFIQQSCFLDITVYGPFELFDEIGSWFQDYNIYLQDPVNNVGRQDVKYCNPHRLSAGDFDACVLVAEVLSSGRGLVGFEDMADRPDLLEVLSTRADLAESSQPAAVGTPLKRHQKQALTFMLRRERGWAFEDEGDIWGVENTHRGIQFCNKISGTVQLEEPPPLRGGVIADPMGLGKTLTMIALTATDREPSLFDTEVDPKESAVEKQWMGATLIIVPPPLLATWQEQIKEHTFENSMKFKVHHGKERLESIHEHEPIDIVLTTYHTVSAEWNWKNKKDQKCSVLFSSYWRRIVLDEAHSIRNEQSQMSRAICELECRARWAVTGTPIQNRLDDLSTLLKFIRAHPYDEPRRFKTDVANLFKSGEEQKAIDRLKYLSASLLLRRPITTISLPSRKDLKLVVDFNPEERKAYDHIRNQAIARIDDALHPSSDTANGMAYANILQRIESLRLFCNLGLHYSSRQNREVNQKIQEDWDSVAQSTFNAHREMESVHCIQCTSSMGLDESLLDVTTDESKKDIFFRCLRLCCGDCVRHLGNRVNCGHSPPCPQAHVSFDGRATEEVAVLNVLGPQLGLGLPSKIRALITDIKSLPRDTKCVVFSTWRLTLDLVEAGLNQESIGNVRFDGKVLQKNRQSVIDKFKKDPDARVMLLTLTCGAVGLTLTVATRAYLMEPHWNPTLEEQALARIHRIGQTREVTTIRLYIRDSFEEQVVKLQTTKKQLAGLLLSPHDGGESDDRLGGLHNLRSLL